MSKRVREFKRKILIKWSPNFAYALGLIATDGCLSKDGRHIDFTSVDIDQLKNFMKALNISCKIGQKYSGAGLKSYRIQIGDVLFYKFLNSIGFTTNKSLTIDKIKIPDIYFFDFLRGCFDGDGGSYSYWDLRWKSSFMFYISFASGSEKFIVFLRNSVTKFSSLKGHVSIQKRKNNRNAFYQLKYSKYEALKLVDLLYRNKECIKLKRKYLKISETLDIVREHKGRVFVR